MAYKLDIIREHSENVWVGETIFRYKKGESFEFDNKTFMVSVSTNKTFRLKDSNGVNYTWKIYGKTYYGESPQVKRLESALTSTIMVDLINELNPLHETHNLTFRLKENLEKQN